MVKKGKPSKLSIQLTFNESYINSEELKIWKISMVLEASNFEDFCLIRMEIIQLLDFISQNTCLEFARHNNI